MDMIERAGAGTGTGYSSLSHLNTLPLDGLKIDRASIAGVDEDPRNEAIVTAVAAMGGAMGLRVVAEGVETPAHEKLAREIGCTMVQGFRFSPPCRRSICASSSSASAEPLRRTGLA